MVFMRALVLVPKASNLHFVRAVIMQLAKVLARRMTSTDKARVAEIGKATIYVCAAVVDDVVCLFVVIVWFCFTLQYS